MNGYPADTSGTIGVLPGIGDGTFGSVITATTDTTAYPNNGRSTPTFVAIGDFNGDGHGDLAVTNHYCTCQDGPGDTISILLNTGGGHFSAPVTYTVGLNPTSIVVGDFNGDGHLDLAVAEYGIGRVGVLLGNGDGTFGPVVDYSPGAVSLAVGDFNGDGHLDLVASSPGSVSVLLGRGDGTFTASPNPGRYDTGDSSSGLARDYTRGQQLVVGDFNGDRLLDVAVINQTASSIGVLLGNGSGGFGPARTYPAGNGPAALTVGDFNGDGHPDLAVTDTSPFGGVYYHAVIVLLNSGDGAFTPGQTLSTDTTPISLVAGDFNGDGVLDLAVANRDSANVTVRLGRGDGAFEDAPRYASGPRPVALAASDLNGDGALDLIAANRGADTVSVYLNQGHSEGTVRADASYPVGHDPSAIATGDVNGDGHPDVVVADAGSNDVRVLLGMGDGTFAPAVSYAVGNYPVALAAGDLNGDGHPDLAVANYADSSVSILLGQGDGTVHATRLTVGALDPNALLIADYTGDGKADLLVANYYYQNAPGIGVQMYQGNGDGTFQGGSSTAVNSYQSQKDWQNQQDLPLALVGGDFNGDGLPDYAVANAQRNEVQIALDSPGGLLYVNFSPPGHTIDTGANPSGVAIGDLNGDGTPDLVVANAGNQDVSVLLATGHGGYLPPRVYATGPLDSFFGGSLFVTSIVLGDFNNDGVLDIAVTVSGQSGWVSVLLGNGDGSFQPGVKYTFTSSNNPRSIVVGDFNGDGHPDLAVLDANAYGGVVQVLLNRGDGTFTAAPPSALSASASTVAVGDFNGDGKLDLAVSSFTQVTILLGRGDGTFQTGWTSAPLPHPDGGAGIAAGDLNGDGHPDLAVRDIWGRVTVLLNTGDGTFQTGASYGPRLDTVYKLHAATIAIRDVTGDGTADIIALDPGHNGVRVLRGNGDGTFQPPVSYLTGIEPSGIAVADLNGDGRPDIVVANYAGNDVSVLLNRTPPRPAGTDRHAAVHADPRPHAHSHGQQHPDADDERDPHAERDPHGCRDANGHSHSHGDGDTDGHRDEHNHSLGYTHGDDDHYANADGHEHSHQCGHSNTDADGDTHKHDDDDASADGDACATEYIHRHRHQDGHGDTNADEYGGGAPRHTDGQRRDGHGVGYYYADEHGGAGPHDVDCDECARADLTGHGDAGHGNADANKHRGGLGGGAVHGNTHADTHADTAPDGAAADESGHSDAAADADADQRPGAAAHTSRDRDDDSRRGDGHSGGQRVCGAAVQLQPARYGAQRHGGHGQRPAPGSGSAADRSEWAICPGGPRHTVRAGDGDLLLSHGVHAGRASRDAWGNAAAGPAGAGAAADRLLARGAGAGDGAVPDHL